MQFGGAAVQHLASCGTVTRQQQNMHTLSRRLSTLTSRCQRAKASDVCEVRVRIYCRKLRFFVYATAEIHR